MNFSLEQNVDILSAYHVERFTYLRDNEQYQDADAIAQEYVCNGEVENDNYQWLYVNYQFKEANKWKHTKLEQVELLTISMK